MLRKIDVDNALVSVIIPIYNAEKYLGDCLDSIIAQTHSNIEIILVDDKSTDNSLKVIKRYAKQEKRIKIIEKDINQGINPARKAGFMKSTGSYIMFVDDDDIISKNLIEEHLKALLKTGTDISISKAFWWNNGDDIDIEDIYRKGSGDIKVLNKKLSYRSLITETSPFSDSEVGILWNKLHKRELFKDYNWELANMPAEDFMTSAYIFNKVNSVVYVDRIHYIHRTNIGSTMDQLKLKKGANTNQKIDIFDALFKIAETFKVKSRENNWDFDKEIIYFKYRYFLIRINAFLSKNNFSSKDFQKIKKYTSKEEVDILCSDDFRRYVDEFIYYPASIVLPSLIDFWSTFIKMGTIVEFLEYSLNQKKSELSERNLHINNLNNIINQKTDQLDKIQSLYGSMFNFLGKIKHRVVRRLIRAPKNIANAYDVKKMNKKYRNCWLVMDRKESASDNGYIFYKHLIKKHPEINSFFVINEDSMDVERLNNEGFRLIFVGSRDHEVAILNSQKLIYAYFTFEFSNDSAQKIFLNHGICKDDTPNPGISSKDYWITAIDRQQEFDSERVDITAVKIGMPRYEPLLKKQENFNSVKNKIIIAPTWRPWLYNLDDLANFRKDDYYINWQKFLSSPELKEMSKEYEIFFIMHPMMSYDNAIGFDMPEFIKSTTYSDLGLDDLQYLLVSANVLITDYSSIFFDASLVGCNIMYFQFDKEKYRTKGHLKPGWFDYDKDGLGPIYYTYDDFINAITNYNGKIESVYKERAKKIYNEVSREKNVSEKIIKLIM